MIQRFLIAASLPGNDVPASRFRLGHCRWDTLPDQNIRDILRALDLIAGRISGVEADQILQEIRYFSDDLFPVDLRSRHQISRESDDHASRGV